MGLAEVKRKQRLVGSARTKNTAWSNDASLPGQRLLSSMGWNAGQGLGVNNSGGLAPISVALKLDNQGIGVQRAKREAQANGTGGDVWFGARGELDALYAQLNASASASAAPSPQPSSSTSPPPSDREASKAKKSDKKRKRKEQEEDGLSKRERKDRDKSKDKDNRKEKKQKKKSVDEDSKKEKTADGDKEKKVKRKKDKEKARESESEATEGEQKKKSKKEKKRKRSMSDQVDSERLTEDRDEASPIVNTVSQYGVFQYLSNRLILRKAQVRRENAARNDIYANAIRSN